MRDIQLVGAGDIVIDPATNKFYAAPSFPYRSNSFMATSNARKNDLYCPPVPAKILEIHQIIANVAGTTTNPLAFNFRIVNFTSGAVLGTIATAHPVTMTPQVWAPIFDIKYDSAPTIMPGQYLQMELTGYSGSVSATNNYSCMAYWRLMVAS